jgi:7,8-dihydropterin-6-yl-methyl-4-(beta-D-ribofuranosyl)aminobenzene 5'-phosphate synthase
MTIITIIYDNRRVNDSSPLESGWGFSCFVEVDDRKILFDVGWNGKKFLRNCDRLKIPIGALDAIILSHIHWDHTGSLPDVVECQPHIPIYVPHDYSKNQSQELESMGATVIKSKDLSILTDLSTRLAVSGTFKAMDITTSVSEQALFVANRAKSEATVILGCTHPGLDLFLESATQFVSPRRIIGGLHGFKDTAVIDRFSMTHLYLGHCTEQMQLFQNIKKVEFHQLHVGMQIEIPD